MLNDAETAACYIFKLFAVKQKHIPLILLFIRLRPFKWFNLLPFVVLII